MKKTKILIIAPYYLPGFKAGGPIQSIKNIVINLHKEADFKILTMDRDLGDEVQYSSIKYNLWNKVERSLVKYCKPEEFNSIGFLRKELKNEEYDKIYLNSSFSLSTIKILLLKKLKLIPNKTIIVAPRGEYSPGALNLKKKKKKCFLEFSKLIRLYSGVIWQGTTKEEGDLIRKIHGNNCNIKIAENLKEIKEIKKEIIKEHGKLKLIFASRISPKKNLYKCLEVLKEIDIKGIEFNIVGPIEDKLYWDKCEKLVNSFKNIKINYLGVQPNDKLLQIFSQNHFLFFPTLGENFGHIILESLMAKTPIIISDQTPWRNLESKKIGWDIPLSDFEGYLTKIKYCYSLDNIEYNKLIKNIDKFLKNYSQEEIIERNKELFLIKGENL